MNIAIKYEKIELGDDKFAFKPVSVIKGEYDEEAEIFETEYGELCVPIDGESKHEESYIGCLTTIEDLIEAYGDMPEEDLLMEFFDSSKDEYCLGFYDYFECKMQIVYIPFRQITKSFVQAPEAYEPTGETVKITLDIEDLKKLRETKNYADINKFYSKLDEIIKYAEIIKEENDKLNKVKTENAINSQPKEQQKFQIKKDLSKVITLKELRKEVKDVIKGQDKAVDDITRAIIVNQASTNPRHKSHMLILGPSGTGKTEMINIISKKMGIPFFKADATAYTKEGYVGKSVYSMFNGLIQSANGDLQKAQNGILIIDEIDKKLSSRKDDVGGIDVLNSLLKIMDRDVIELETGRSAPVLFDTSNLTIIFMGAFADLYKEKEEKQKEEKNKRVIGFACTSDNESEVKKEKVVITNEDLIKSGMPPEFLGRIPIVTNTEELELEDLVEILYKSKGGAIDEEKEFCNGLGITIKFTSGYMREIARKAHESKTGARNLRKLVRESLSHAYDEILTGKDVKVLKLTKKTAIDSKKYYTE